MADPLLLPASSPQNILVAARILREGGVVVVPTDTLYGVAASVFQEEAVRRIYRIKSRPSEKRVPVLIGTAADLTVLAAPPPPVIWKLIGEFWPGGLTLVLPASRSAPRSIARSGGTVAVRVPASISCLQLLQVLGEPIVGTSANRSGRPAATTAQQALEQLPGVDAVLADDRAVRGGAPSTIVEAAEGSIDVLRAGAVSADEIRRVVGPSTIVREQLPDEADGR